MFDNETTVELDELERLYLNANWTPLLNSAYWSRDQQQYISPVYRRDPLYVVIPITVLYAAILVSGVVGNISTCIVISRNKHMHTATNYYLFSLAISDLLLLVSGLPQEMYYIWSRYYVFGEAFCVLTGFAAETSANATVLTITAFTVERYVAICHPFLSHTVSKLSRAVKFVIAIWLLALCLAVPQALGPRLVAASRGATHITPLPYYEEYESPCQSAILLRGVTSSLLGKKAIQFGVVIVRAGNSTVFEEIAQCTMKWVLLEHAFEISTLLFFVAPMTLITVLYVLIGLKLRRSRLLKRPSLSNAAERQNTKNQNRVIRMLVAVVVAFFVCWAPFHSQRLLAVYASSKADPSAAVVALYNALTYVSGILYYLSTTVNPVLYHIMSHKFREAFKSTLAQLCGRGRKDSIHTRTYSILSRGGTHTQLVAPHRASVSCVNAKEIPNHAQRLQRQKSAPVVPETLRLNTNPQGGIRPPKQRSPIDVFAKRLRLLPKNSAAQMSIDSNNTISNSSLQDLDESEFTGSELAHYMGELNNR